MRFALVLFVLLFSGICGTRVVLVETEGTKKFLVDTKGNKKQSYLSKLYQYTPKKNFLISSLHWGRLRFDI